MSGTDDAASKGPGGNVVELTPWDQTVRRARRASRPSALLDRKDADQTIRALTPLEGYYLVKEAGPDDAAPFLSLFDAPQLLTLFDLEGFNHEGIAIDDMLVWFAACRQSGVETVQRAARALDMESLATLFRRRLWVGLVPVEDEEDPPEWTQLSDDELGPIIRTPEGTYLIAARKFDEFDALGDSPAPIDEEDQKAVLQLVDDLYRDPDFVRISAILRTAEADLTSTLEEESLHFRNARLEDLGFPPIARAIEVYGQRAPASLTSGEPQERVDGSLRLPALFVNDLQDGLLFDALRRIDDGALVRAIESELVPVANAMLVADGVDPAQLDGVAEGLRRMRGYIELAIAHDTAPATVVETAAKRLSQHPIRDLFQVGYTLTLQLATRGRDLATDDGLSAEAPLSLLSTNDRALLDALRRRRPMTTTAIDGDDPAVARSITRATDLARTHRELDRVAAMAAVSVKYDFPRLVESAPSTTPPANEWTLDLLLATFLANFATDRGVNATPLDAEGLEALADACAADELAEAASGFLPALGVEGAAVLQPWVDRTARALSDAFSGLSGQPINPRFVDGVIAAL